MNELDNKISDVMYALFRLMKEDITYDTKTAHLTILQLQALVFLKKNNKAQMKEIANHFRVEMPTATSLLNTLHRMGLIVRKPDAKDRRIVRISLTKQGSDILKKAKAQHSRKVTRMLSYLSDMQKKNLLSLFETLLERMQSQYEK